MTFVIYLAWRNRPIVVRIFNKPTAKSLAIKAKIAEARQRKALAYGYLPV